MIDPASIQPDLWAQHGPLGLVCGALFIAIWKLVDTQRIERREMREESAQRTEQLMALQRETNLAIQGLTMALERNNERFRRGDPQNGG